MIPVSPVIITDVFVLGSLLGTDPLALGPYYSTHSHCRLCIGFHAWTQPLAQSADYSLSLDELAN